MGGADRAQCIGGGNVSNVIMPQEDWVDLLDAIREKGGTSALMTTSEATAAVEAIETGGGGQWTTEGVATNAEPNGAVTVQAVTIPGYAFYNKPITSIYAPNCKTLNRYALNGTQITSVTDANFPVLSGRVTFTNWTGVVSIELSGSGIAIDDGSGPFRNCTSLVSLKLPNASQNIPSYYGKATGNNFAEGDTNLEICDLGFCTGIGANSFNGDKKLQTLILRRTDSICALTNVNALYNTPFRGAEGLVGTVYVPSALIAAYQAASNWSTLYTAGTCVLEALEGSVYE